MAEGRTPLREQVGSLPDDYLQCRYPNHWWRRVRVSNTYVDRRRVVRIDFVCQCGAERKDILGANGDRISSGINYPDGYLIVGHGRVDRAKFRVETIARYLQNGKDK